MHRIPARRTLALVLAALAAAIAAGAVLAPHGEAGATAPRKQAVTVSCGHTITASIVVGNDLTDCPSTALTVTGSHVTVNLNKHTIDGVGSGTGVSASGASVTVSNGTIRQFSVGVLLTGTGDRAQGLHVSGSTFGINANADSVVITGNFVFGVNIGIRDLGGAHTQVTGNWARGNGSAGIEVNAPGALVSGNRAIGNVVSGLAISGPGGAVVSGNVANGNGGDGILTTSNSNNPNTLTKNTARFNSALGINGGLEDTDGGGNVTNGNGSLHQCNVVVCS